MEYFEGYLVQFEGLLRKNKISNPKIEAYILASTLDAVSMMNVYDMENYPIEGIKKQLIKKYCIKWGNEDENKNI